MGVEQLISCKHSKVGREVILYKDEIFENQNGKYVLVETVGQGAKVKDAFQCHDCYEWFNGEELGIK